MELSKIIGTLDTPVNYHRLMKGPLDDKEIFSNLDDLMEYCKNGTCYDGQHVVVLDNMIGTYIEYIIINNIPIIDFKGSEPIFMKYDNNIYMLLFEENLISGQKWGKNIWFSLEEGRYNIVSQTSIFGSDTGEFNYIYEIFDKDKIENNNTLNTITGSNIFKLIDGEIHCNISYDMIDLNKIIFSNSYTAIDNNNINKISKIWVMANEYYNAYNKFKEGDLNG